jgi:methylthioribose-1-phosphate isomerase
MDGTTLHLIHQPSLPHEFKIVTTTDFRETADAIKTMVVRGAGAIGAAAAGGMAQAVAEIGKKGGSWAEVEGAAALLRNTRPTAQNLFYGIDKVIEAAQPAWGDAKAATSAALDACQAVADEDVAACEAIGKEGASLIEDGSFVLTYCNAGWLAFVDWGSALSPIYTAQRAGKKLHVLVPETQPRGQGARLTAWELSEEEVPHTIITDAAVGLLCAQNQIGCIIVGADRIAANGDVANKIGTYTLAVLANVHEIPFYVAAPTSTIDLGCATGQDIPIEQREDTEVLTATGMHPEHGMVTVQTANETSPAYNPAFDVTPGLFIRGIITEKGVVEPKGIKTLMA